MSGTGPGPAARRSAGSPGFRLPRQRRALRRGRQHRLLAFESDGQAARPAGQRQRALHQARRQQRLAVPRRGSALGRTHVQLDGSLGAPRDIRFALDADDLSLLDPAHAAASPRAAATPAPTTAPLLLFKARGADFEWQGYQRGRRSMPTWTSTCRDEGHAQGKVDLTGIHYGARTAQQATHRPHRHRHDAARRTWTSMLAPLRAVLTARGHGREASSGTATSRACMSPMASDLDLQLERAAPVALDLAELRIWATCASPATRRAAASVHGAVPTAAGARAFSAQDDAAARLHRRPYRRTWTTRAPSTCAANWPAAPVARRPDR